MFGMPGLGSNGFSARDVNRNRDAHFRLHLPYSKYRIVRRYLLRAHASREGPSAN